MNQDKFSAILNDAVNDKDLGENEIPQIDLYLEQIIRLISDKNLQGSPSYYHRFPTKTMVNNYSKAGLISPLKGKTYNKEQIIQILLTNSLKNTLSIAEIKDFRSAFEISDGDISLTDAYEKYIEMKDVNREICPIAIEKLISENNLSVENNMDCIMLSMGLASLADYIKCISRALLESTADELGVHNQPEDEEMSEKEMKKAAKKQKKAEAKAEKEAAHDTNDAESEFKAADDTNPAD